MVRARRGHRAPDARRRGRLVAIGRRAGRVVEGPAQTPEEGLARGPDKHGLPEGEQGRQVGQQRPVVLGGLGEAESGVEHERLGGDPSGEDRVAAVGELAAYLGDDVVVDRARLHVGAVSAPVHCDVRHPAGGHEGHHVLVGEPTAHVVDESGTEVQGRGGDVGSHRVDTECEPVSYTHLTLPTNREG